MSNTTIESNKNPERKNFLSALFETLLRQHDIRKCESIKDIVGLIGSFLLGFLGTLSIKSRITIIFALLVSVVSIVIWYNIDHVIRRKQDKEKDKYEDLKSQINDLNNKLIQTEKEKNNIEHKKGYIDSLWAETSLLAKEINRIRNSSSAKRLYTKLADSISQMIMASSDLKKDQFSVYVYMYDGKSRLIRRVEVASCVSTLQTANETNTVKIDDVGSYYYAKCILSKKSIFFLKDNAEIRKHFYFRNGEDPIISHYSQYIAMSYKLGDGMEMYVEAISYDEKCFGDNLDDFISKTLSPFADYVSMIPWRRIRGGFDGKRKNDEAHAKTAESGRSKNE